MAEDIFKVIFQMEAEGQGVLDEITKTKAKYIEVNEVVKKQEKELASLLAKEAQLIANRNKANSVSAVAKYNAELTVTTKKIREMNAGLEKANATEKQLIDTTGKLSRDLNNAFKTTQINALDNEVRKLTADFKVNNAAAESGFGKVRNEEEKLEVKTRSLRAQLKDLKAQLAETDDDNEFERLSIAAGKLQDKIDDASQAARVFATDSPFESVGISIGNVAQKLLSMDFNGAAQQSRLLAKATSQITFKTALGGIKDLGTTLLNVGKSLLANPIFLIGTAIFLIIKNFNELKNSGGAVGATFRFIGDIIDGVTETFFALTDAIGATSHALDKLNEKKLSNLSKQIEADTKALDNFAKIVRAQGKETDAIEKRKNELIIENSKKQIDILRGIQKEKGLLSEDNQKLLDDALARETDAQTELKVIEFESLQKRKEASKKYAEDTGKIFTDLKKKLIEEQREGTQFQIDNTLNPNGNKQIEEQFNLRKRIEKEQFKELEKNSLKELKTKADIEKAKALLTKIRIQQEFNFDNDKDLALLNAAKERGQKLIDQQKEQADLELSASSDTELGIARNKLNIQQDYFNASIALLEADIAKRKELQFNTVEQEKELAKLKIQAQVETAKGQDELNALQVETGLKQIEALESHAKTELELRNARHSTVLKNEIKFEKDKLTILEEGGKKYTQEYKNQQDKIAQMSKEAHKQEVLEYVGYTETIVNAALAAANKVIAAKIQEVDKQSSLQQKRVDEAKDIASSGNAELLEEEKKRLENLNKEKEKFVRQQQALATVELIANTAIAVSKAAAEGGVAAGITIAAALIALIAGLASARSIASQAAFYEGGMYNGEGYTGDGNPREQSHAQGYKPYTYHKKEFIFNHQKTGKYKDIFQKIHEGEIDLNEWEYKIKLFDSLKGGMNLGANINPSPHIVNNTIEISELKNQMSTLIDVVSNMHTDITMDDRGFSAHLSKVHTRMDFIKNKLAKL